jgi:hypothetical protein
MGRVSMAAAPKNGAARAMHEVHFLNREIIDKLEWGVLALGSDSWGRQFLHFSISGQSI